MILKIKRRKITHYAVEEFNAISDGDVVIKRIAVSEYFYLLLYVV